MTRLGVAHIPEDRLGEGLVGNLPLTDNAVLKSYDRAAAGLGPVPAPAARRAVHADRCSNASTFAARGPTRSPAC